MFGLIWLPSVLVPTLKAVTRDLNNTLRQGILTEDGPAGIVVSGAHRQLPRSLLAWACQLGLAPPCSGRLASPQAVGRDVARP